MAEQQENYGKPQRYIVTVDFYLYSNDPVSDADISATQIQKFVDNVSDVAVLTIDEMPFGGKRSINIYTKQ